MQKIIDIFKRIGTYLNPFSAKFLQSDLISKKEQFDWLESLGFETVENALVNKDTIEEEVLKYKEKVKTYDIPSDGLVLTFDDTPADITTSYDAIIESNNKYNALIESELKDPNSDVGKGIVCKEGSCK